MIFRRGSRRDDDDLDDEEDEDEEEIDYVLFQGALNDADVDLNANRRLTQAGLLPAKELVTDALMRRANRIRVEPKGQSAQVVLYIDSVPFPSGRLPGKQALAVTQMVKLLSGLDIQNRQTSQRGGIRAEHDDVKYELHVQSDPVGNGAERLTITIRDPKKQLDSPKDLGFSDRMREAIREKTAEKRGVIVVCGPPFSGLTSTTVGTVRAVDSFIYSVYALADLEGRDLTNISPVQYRENETLDMLTDRLKRSDADVLYLGPIRNAESAQDVFAQSEKMALITEMPAKDAAHGLCQLVSWLGAETIAQKLDLVISPKLCRTLCDKCKEAYKPHPRLLDKLGLPPETKLLYRPAVPPDEEDEDFDDYEPCRQCGGLGYFGQAAMFELIEMTDDMKGFVAREPSPQQVKAATKKLDMPTMQSEGLRLVVEGRTSLEELKRLSPASK